jgi:hypothetical protein
MSKFTAVDGCAAFAKTPRMFKVSPAAMEASTILRRVSMPRYLAGCRDIGGCRVSSRMKRRFPHLLMVNNLNPSLFFRKA